MSNTPLFDGFVEFCANQPADGAINHSMFETCAIGKYSNHLEGEYPPVGSRDVFEDIVDELYLVNLDVKNEFEHTIDNGLQIPKISTYGGMSEFLNKIKSDLVNSINTTKMSKSE